MYEIGSELRVGGADVATALFDYLAQCLCEFVEENDLVSVPLPLGMCTQTIHKNRSHPGTWLILHFHFSH